MVECEDDGVVLFVPSYYITCTEDSCVVEDGGEDGGVVVTLTGFRTHQHTHSHHTLQLVLLVLVLVAEGSVVVLKGSHSHALPLSTQIFETHLKGLNPRSNNLYRLIVENNVKNGLSQGNRTRIHNKDEWGKEERKVLCNILPPINVLYLLYWEFTV